MSDILNKEQQQRMEALNNAAALLVDRSVNSGTLFTKGDGSMKAEGLLNAAGTSSHLAQATVTIIDLAEYVISGPEPSETEVEIDEHGMRVTS